jgi:hypothetical protein
MDKWGALSYLTETTTNFVGVDSSSDTRSFSINFLNIFGSQIHSIVAGLVLGDPSLYGPAWELPDPDEPEEVGEYARRETISLFRTRDFEPETHKLIDPNDRFFVRYISLIMAAAWSVQETNERDLNTNFKIGMTGSIDDHAVPDLIRNDPARYIELTNPVTHRTYFAVRTENFGWSLPEEGERFVALGYDLLTTITNRYYENGNFKAVVLDQYRNQASAQDPSLNGASLDAAATTLANVAVHEEFFWVDLIRSIVDTYEMR